MNSQLKSLTRLKTSLITGKTIILTDYTHDTLQLMNHLWDEGFISGYSTVSLNKHTKLKIFVKHKHKQAVLKSLQTVSKFSRKPRKSLKAIWKTLDTLTLTIVKTPKGLSSSLSCKKQRFSGSPLLHVC